MFHPRGRIKVERPGTSKKANGTHIFRLGISTIFKEILFALEISFWEDQINGKQPGNCTPLTDLSHTRSVFFFSSLYKCISKVSKMIFITVFVSCRIYMKNHAHLSLLSYCNSLFNEVIVK